MFHISAYHQLDKDLAFIPDSIRNRIILAIKTLRNNPFPSTFKKLKDTKNGYRLRVGDYRILYEIDIKQKIIYVTAVGHRKEIYR